MNFVSTFLSHSSTDKALVESVAKRLGHRGVFAWLDKNELREMGPLDVALKNAVQQQATLTLFLSEASLKSDWCNDELRWALEAQEGYAHILPVYLGNPLSLVRGNELLRNRFLVPDGDRVNQLGYCCNQNPANPDPNTIADMIAATAYRRSIPERWSEVIIILDQRGSGSRRGLPDVPPNFESLNAPTLTFRPSLNDRQPREILIEDDWTAIAHTLERSLSLALNTVRGETRKVRVLGYPCQGEY
ncbi:MAG: toll/interleukin-1 receptor domain-containing protein [Thermosynechococcaceae cyanobacterium]